MTEATSFITLCNCCILTAATLQDYWAKKVYNVFNAFSFCFMIGVLALVQVEVRWETLLYYCVITLILQAIQCIGGGDGKLLLVLAVSLSMSDLNTILWSAGLFFIFFHSCNFVALTVNKCIKMGLSSAFILPQGLGIRVLLDIVMVKWTTKNFTKRRFTYCILLGYLNLIVK